MPKLTPWFDAKLHSPVREGWHDCKECKARHYFKDGSWYRKKRSVKNDWRMTIHKMHWRGLAWPPLKSLLAQYDPSVPRSAEEQAWENMAPVGREFGSPDYERLMEEDAAAAYKLDDGQLTEKQVTDLRKDVEKHLPRGKLISRESLLK